MRYASISETLSEEYALKLPSTLGLIESVDITECDLCIS